MCCEHRMPSKSPDHMQDVPTRLVSYILEHIKRTHIQVGRNTYIICILAGRFIIDIEYTGM